MIYRTITATLAAAALAGCAAQPDTVAPSYVSPAAYQGMSCTALNAEAARVSAALSDATGRQKQAADSDVAMTAITLLVFWPALLFVGNSDHSVDLARLKGEADGIRGAALARGCK